MGSTCDCGSGTNESELVLNSFDPKRKDKFIELSSTNWVATGFGHSIGATALDPLTTNKVTFKILKS